MKNVTIIGIGLIGGSLALSLKQHDDVRVTGFDVQTSSLEKALQLEVIDQAATSLTEAVTDADFVFLCVPVGFIENVMTELSRLPMKKGCILTDVGSTKQTVVKWSKKLSNHPVYFIGGHPMAGSHKSGIEAASSILFENAYYILTPSESVPEEEVSKLTHLLKPTKAKILRLDPAEHDRVVGAISHLPHLVAAVLVNQVAQYNDSNDLYQSLAAGGFRDITRIASSNPRMWRDILISNRDVLLSLAQDWKDWMQKLVDLIDQQNGEEIENFFNEAKQFRNQLPERRKGAISAIYDLFLDVPDHPGIIARVTAILANHNINLSNIQIIESREDAPGALRLSFRNDLDMDQAHHLLMQEGFQTHQRD
jgi:prephenate dehydrogenase